MSKSEKNTGLINDVSAGLLKKHTSASPATLQKSKEHRSVPRFYVRWRVLAMIDAKSQHQGFIKDISMKGAAVFLDRNLQSVELIKLHIHVPPSHTEKTPRVITVYGKVVYTVYDNHERLFRAGVCFLKFDSEHDPIFLDKYLTTFQTRVL